MDLVYNQAAGFQSRFYLCSSTSDMTDSGGSVPVH